MPGAPWQRYVRMLCADAWELDARSTEKLLKMIDALVAADDLTDAALARTLLRVGVTPDSAHLIAPSIRVAIAA